MDLYIHSHIRLHGVVLNWLRGNFTFYCILSCISSYFENKLVAWGDRSLVYIYVFVEQMNMMIMDRKFMFPIQFQSLLVRLDLLKGTFLRKIEKKWQ
jgi:hypothetical protein